MTWSRLRLIVVVLAIVLPFVEAHAQLRGHGGPVRAVAIAPDGKSAASGSFDSSVIRWSLERNAAEQVLRFHDGAVNAVAMLPDRRLATAGEDGRIALWGAGVERPAQVLEGHQAPVASLAVSPDGRDARLGFMGPDHPPVAAGGRCAARARGPSAERQWRGVCLRRPQPRQRRL